jgi:hypothetical protein
MSATEVPVVSITAPHRGPSGAGEQQRVAVSGDQESGGARLLIGDASIVCLLLNDARYRAVGRLFGVGRDQSFLVTVVGVGTLALALHERAARMRPVPAVPSLGDAVLAAGVLRASVHGVAGTLNRDTPLFNSLIAIALLGSLARPVLRVSFRDAGAVSRRARVTFDNRYGHLIRRGRRPR